MIRFTVPVKTTNPLNGAQGRTRGAVFAKAARRRKEREAARLMAMGAYASEWPVPAVVKPKILLRRVSAGTLDDDGLRAALKSIRDGIADWLKIDDGDPRLTWLYDQRKCKRGEYAVEVEIT